MQRYKTIKALGDGTYGSVFKAVNRATGDIVAIKVTQDPHSSCALSRRLRGLGLTRSVPPAPLAENEEEVLLVGGVHAAARGAVFAQAVAPQHCQAQGGARAQPPPNCRARNAARAVFRPSLSSRFLGAASQQLTRRARARRSSARTTRSTLSSSSSTRICTSCARTARSSSPRPRCATWRTR